MHYSQLLAFALSLATTNAAYQGFNYGATNPDGSYRQQSDFQQQFETAKNLVGTSGFTSARLYTTIQGGTTSDVTSAIPAAIQENTSLLLGLWASAGQDIFNNEVTALKNAINTYGDSFTKLVVGISVGSEDLYRNSPTGIQAKAGIGANPDTIVSYIKQVREAIAGTALSSAKIGHVDTWTAWANTSNVAVSEAADWIGVDAYPYFQNTEANSINDANGLFNDAIAQVENGASGKEIWITETGWPVSGPTENEAVANTANAKTYWDQVGCPRFGKTNIWWYTLQDAPTSPSFGIVGQQLSTTPLFDLSCGNTTSTSTKNASAASSSAVVTATGVSHNASATGAAAGAGASSAAAAIPAAAAGASSAAAPAAEPCETEGAGSGASPAAGAAGAAAGAAAGSNSTGAYIASPSGVRPAAGAGQGSNGTYTIVAKPTLSSSSTAGAAAAQFTNGAAANSGSMIAAIGAIFAVVQAL